MAPTTGEMPFLDHLEELRGRILKALAAIIIGFGLGLWLVQHFALLQVLKQPIAPFLPDGKLTVLSPTEPLMILLKLALITGLVLASPVLLWQLWAFLAPALYERERKALVPALFAGLGLFLTGAALGFFVVVPQALRVLLVIEADAFQTMITYDKYFGFVMQIVLALGLSFELPLGIILLAWLGVVTPARLAHFRRFAIVLSLVAGAFLSPGGDPFSMMMMSAPLVLLYEVGYFGAVLIQRRRARMAAALVLLALLGLPGAAGAQEPVRPRPRAPRDSLQRIRPDSQRPDTTRPRPGQALDTAAARRLGLPTGPSQSFAPADSVVRALMARMGYQTTRFRADSATLLAEERRINLHGSAMTERGGSVLEAAAIRYREADCLLDAEGQPRVFDGGTVLVGDAIRYNTCTRRAVVQGALTNFQEGGVAWFLRGDVAQDSSSSRIYASSSEITSCDLPEPHYHFAAREVKWISKTVLVARPAVLYVRDVPILWLPFIFQDARPGRRSGILVPQFGFNDLVRPTPGYRRQVTNVGYYWAPNDYVDLTARLDWFSGRYLQYGLAGQYRWLDRFLNGNVAWNRQQESEGSSSTSLRWDHRQNFNLSTSLTFNLNYVSNTRILDRNAVDPLLNTQQISSALNFSKRFNWGTVTVGGNRRQSLSDRSTSTQFPAMTIAPKPLDLAGNVTWSPGLSLTNDLATNTPLPALLAVTAGGRIDTIAQTADRRTTAFSLTTPLRLGSFNWRNSLRVTDQQTTGRQTPQRVRIPDPNSTNPADSVDVDRYFNGDFSTTIDWDTGINLPLLFRGSWKLQPILGITNTTSGAFAIRNRATNGQFVQQGKRFSLALNANPTIFGFLNRGIGPFARFRHSLSPIIGFNYAPAADIPLDYARAVTAPGATPRLRSPPVQTLSIGLSQNFEAKYRPAPGDTAASAADRKLRLLSIATSAVSYDFEQAKEPGRTGWTTQTLSNSVQSDLLPGFSLSLVHDLWAGPVGFDTTRFDPFLQSVNASFGLSGRTIRGVLGLFGLAGSEDGASGPDQVPSGYVAESARRARPGAGSFYSSSQLPSGLGRRGFTANVNYTLSRTRPVPGATTATPDRQNLGFSSGFSPTPFWSISWSAQYNVTDHKFESQIVRLERDLHEWRAGFNFVRNANGNFAFFFSIYLTDLPEIKFDYDQTTIER